MYVYIITLLSSVIITKAHEILLVLDDNVTEPKRPRPTAEKLKTRLARALVAAASHRSNLRCDVFLPPDVWNENMLFSFSERVHACIAFLLADAVFLENDKENETFDVRVHPCVQTLSDASVAPAPNLHTPHLISSS